MGKEHYRDRQMGLNNTVLDAKINAESISRKEKVTSSQKGLAC